MTKPPRFSKSLLQAAVLTAGIAAILAGVVLGQSRARRRRASAPTPTAELAAAAR